MAVAEDVEKSLCAIYVDMGTTNSRVWLMFGERVLVSTNASVGVRDGSARVRASLRESIAEVGASAPCVPRYVAAAGMIGSSLGLVEVPHLRPPVGVRELIAGASWHHFPEVTELPVLLIPGVRSEDEQP